jgi:hypothetical protein
MRASSVAWWCVGVAAGFLGPPDRILCCVPPNESALEKPDGKKAQKTNAKKRKKQNLGGMDFQGLMDLRDQVENALSGYRSTLEEQLASIGDSIARREDCSWRSKRNEGNEGCAEVSWSWWGNLGGSRC